MTPQEKERLRNFEIPLREEEEWRATPTALKWETLGNLKFAYHGEKKVKTEVDTTGVAPVSARTAPPKVRPGEGQTQKGVNAKKGFQRNR